MLAAGLSILLCVFWGLVGYACLLLLRRQGDPLQNILLAPVTGLAFTVLPILGLSQLGLPVESFGKLLALILVMGGAVVLWKNPTQTAWRSYLPFTGVFLLALLITGRPLFEFGFDWLSYANDDMANYSLGADRFLHHGFFDTPDLNDLVNGQDYSLFSWFLYAPLGVRPGSELLLAWICSLTGLTAHQVFMPTILAYHLILISTSAALVYQSKAFRLSALLTCILLSFSALNSLGTLYQLIAQMSGLSLLVGCITLLLHPFTEMKLKAVIKHGLLTGILVSGLFVIYPEVVPFLLLSLLLYETIGLIRKQFLLKPIALISGITIVVVVLLLNTYLLRVFVFLLSQTTTGIENKNPTEFAFPAYLVPSGLASLWGMQSFSNPSSEPWLSITIAFAIILLISLTCAAIWLTWGRLPIATVTVVMLCLGMFLFIRSSDFGLFKLAMFIQPFMLGTVAIVCTHLIQQPMLRIVPIFLIGCLSFQTQTKYVQVSQGVKGFSGIPNISQLQVNREFRKTIDELSLLPSQNLVLNTSNIVLAKFQGLYTKKKVTIFPTQGFFFFKYFPTGNTANAEKAFPGAETTKISTALTEQLNKNVYEATFNTLETQANSFKQNKFFVPNLKQIKENLSDSVLISPGFKQSILNERGIATSTNQRFIVQPWIQARNQLMLINSVLGYEYYLGGVLGVNSDRIAIQQLEPDLFRQNQMIAGIGQYITFQIVNPSEQVRLVLDMTSTLNADGENKLPPASIIGSKRQPVGLLGRGSARIFSKPFDPQMIIGLPYVGIDMGVAGKSFSSHRTGLMRLYGKNISLDRRKIVSFGRDISLISEEEYVNLNPPSQIKAFPADLANPDLEYSGVYEDGWVSEAAFFNLKQPDADTPLMLQGTLPEIKDSAFSTDLTILVDGKEVARQRLKPGEFNIQSLIHKSKNRRRIDLRFSKFQSLPKGDDRPVAAQLKFIGFKENG